MVFLILYFLEKITNLIYYSNDSSHLFVIRNKKEFVLVIFIGGEVVIFKFYIKAMAPQENKILDIFSLQVGTEFLIVEGSTIVGEGLVKEIFSINHMGGNS